MNRAVAVCYAPRLTEEAVFLALRQQPEQKEFQQERDRLYEIADAEQRERLFEALHDAWFARLELGTTVAQALGEQPSIGLNVEACVVRCAAQAKQEGAELFVAPADGYFHPACRTLRILLRPEALLRADALLTFLRRELFHIADMLDPQFAYEPTLPKAEGGPTYDTLVINRYRVLWDITIDGRMVRCGWLASSARDQRRGEFRQAFPMLGETGEKYFRGFFDGDRPKHAELAAFAFDPRTAAKVLKRQSAAGTHCPLCKFPSHLFEPEPENLGDEVLAAISRDFPPWKPALGLCAQCADLYRAGRLSMAAARLLPGWKPCRTSEPPQKPHNPLTE